MPEPLQAGLWGLVAALALVLGAVIALAAPVPRRAVALVLSFGAGALVSALAFDLSDEAFRVGGTFVFAAGLAVGALVYYVGDHLIDRLGPGPACGARRAARPSCWAPCSTGSRSRSSSVQRSSAGPA